MTPSQELAMEVLCARYRLGEDLWTFKSEHAKTLKSLEAEGLVWTMHGVVRGSIRAGLTDKGKRLILSSSYVPPVVSEMRRALAAYRSALRSHEPESEQLRELGDLALAMARRGD